MSDYSKLKVADLKELLTKRGLSTAGKKEELITRLAEADVSQSTAKEDTTIANPPEDEIDWDNTDAGATDTKQTGAAPATVGPSVEKKEIKIDTSDATDPASQQSALGEKKKFTFKRLADEFDTPKPAATSTTATTEKSAETGTTESKDSSTPGAETSKAATSPAESFAAGLAQTNSEAELEKRKARAARFGVQESDSVKALERARRFGNGEEATKDPQPTDKTVKALDQALGENRGKKRGPDTRIQNDPKKSKDDKKQAPSTKVSSASSITSDPTEKAKAEARAKRFGTSA